MSLKVTLFGGTGQGKTTYTLALLYMMAAGIDGFRIEAEDADTATKYLNPWRDFVIAKKWPAPTMGRREDHFRLLFQNEYITDFRWVDYQGGALNTSTDESDDAAQLHADIQESNAVIIVADAYTIATRPVIEAEMLTSATYIFNLLNNYKFKQSVRGEGINTGITIALVLTKADILPEEYKANNYQGLFDKSRQVFRGVVDFVQEQRANTSSLRPWLYPSGMIPTSIVGEGNASVLQDPGSGYELPTISLDSPPEPVNVHYPFLYAIGNELDRTALYLEEEVSDLEERLGAMNNNVLNRILRGRSIRQLHDERLAVAERLKVLEPKIRAVTAVANKKMRSLIPS